MGEGLCPQTAVSGSSPSWGRRACLSGGNTPREDTFLFATLPLPPTSLHCLPSSWGRQPALKNAPLTKPTLPASPLPLQCAGLSRKQEHAGLALPRVCPFLIDTLWVGWAEGQPSPLPEELCSLTGAALPWPPPPIRLKELFHSFCSAGPERPSGS